MFWIIVIWQAYALSPRAPLKLELHQIQGSAITGSSLLHCYAKPMNHANSGYIWSLSRQMGQQVGLTLDNVQWFRIIRTGMMYAILWPHPHRHYSTLAEVNLAYALSLGWVGNCGASYCVRCPRHRWEASSRMIPDSSALLFSSRRKHPNSRLVGSTR